MEVLDVAVFLHGEEDFSVACADVEDAAEAAGLAGMASVRLMLYAEAAAECGDDGVCRGVELEVLVGFLDGGDERAGGLGGGRRLAVRLGREDYRGDRGGRGGERQGWSFRGGRFAACGLGGFERCAEGVPVQAPVAGEIVLLGIRGKRFAGTADAG